MPFDFSGMPKSIPEYLMDASGRLYRITPIVPYDEQAYRVVPTGRETEVRRDLRVRYGFTEREAEIAILLGVRATNSEIAEELGISLHTVRHHAERVLEKAGLRSRAQVQGVITRATTGRSATPIKQRRKMKAPRENGE